MNENDKELKPLPLPEGFPIFFITKEAWYRDFWDIDLESVDTDSAGRPEGRDFK